MVDLMKQYNFEHTHSKSGEDYQFGDLGIYVNDLINKGEYDENEKDYVVECPYCKNAYLHDKSYSGQYNKRKLYVLKNFSVGFCFRCDQHFVNLGNDDEIKVNEIEIPEASKRLQEYDLVKLDDNKWKLDMFDGFATDDPIGFEYLTKKRHSYLGKLSKLLNIKYLHHNPVIPFYYKGELFYYQVRYIHPEEHGDRKYFNPPIDHKPPYVVEHGDNKKFIICEGTFDAISLLIQAPSYTPMAVLGSTITDYQLSLLRGYVPEKILVYMDETKLSIKVAEKIRYWINYADVDIIPSNGQDPEEMLKSKIANELELQWIK